MNKISFKKTVIFILGLIFLFSAHTSFAESIDKRDLAYVLPEANIFARHEEPFGHFLGYTTEGGHFIGVVFLTTEVVPQETWGYRDQIVTLIGVDSKGKITGVKILEENETPRYTRGLLQDDSWFLEQFKNKDAGDEFLLGKDVDAITGATISSSSITRAIESGLEIVTEKILYAEVEKDTPVKHVVMHHLLWQMDFIFLWMILGIAFTAFFKKSRILRYLVLGLSIVYIGFLKGGGFSITDVLNIFSLNLPIFLNNLYWYSLVIIAIGLTIVAGRFYCGWLCPFGAVLETSFKLVPVEYRVPRDVDMYLKLVKYVIFVILLFIYFIFANRTLATYIASIIEPFATFFKLYGGLIFWIWLISILIISSVISRFFCRYFCPLGAFFAFLSEISALLKLRKFNVSLPVENCKGCKLAQKTCQMAAISYSESLKRPEIDRRECFMCNTCADICPVESKADRKKEI